MKKIYLLTLLITFLLQGNSWGSECIGFENMSIKILRQESDKVYLTWNTSVFNKCNKMISAKIQVQLVDKEENSLGNGYLRVNQLLPKENREVKNQKILSSEVYFKIKGYYFKANELSDIIE